LCATTHGGSGGAAFIAADEASAQTVPGSAGIEYLMRPALTVRMENLPGTGAATFRKLADAGVNADLLLPFRISDELFSAMICVDDPAAARGALVGQVVNEQGARPRLSSHPPGIRPGLSAPRGSHGARWCRSGAVREKGCRLCALQRRTRPVATVSRP
jgi:hypothetical protein